MASRRMGRDTAEILTKQRSAGANGNDQAPSVIPKSHLEPDPLFWYISQNLMGSFYSFLFPWNLIIQAIAVIHFIRRRPDTYWLWIILIGGGLGAIVYIFVEVLPD